MVITKIFMGLGNQLFQYAAGRSLSLHHNTVHKVDTSSYAGYPLRRYGISKYFETTVEEVTAEEIAPFAFRHPVKRIWNKAFPKHKLRYIQFPYEEPMPQRALLKGYDFFYPPHKRKVYTEPHYHFDPHFYEANSDILLHGFWMSWKYFEKHDSDIRKDLTVKPGVVANVSSVADEMRNTNSISIHIRRGDLTNKSHLHLKGLVPIGYYQRGIEEIKNKTADAVVYVFSDDIEWAKQHLQTTAPVVFVSKEISHSEIEDLYLMTQCKHNIIGNSTFSWWSAYLNNNENKIVIAPKNWYVVDKYNCKDVYPPSWNVRE